MFRAIVQPYLDGLNSKIFFCFCFFVFVWTRCVLLFLPFTESILMAFFGGYSFERNSTTQRHHSLSNSSHSNCFNKIGFNKINIQICYSILCSDPSSNGKNLNSALINVPSFVICSQTAIFDNNVCLLAVVPKVYSHSITWLLAILQWDIK